jgi:hypothetical protein
MVVMIDWKMAANDSNAAGADTCEYPVTGSPIVGAGAREPAGFAQ